MAESKFKETLALYNAKQKWKGKEKKENMMFYCDEVKWVKCLVSGNMVHMGKATTNNL